MVTWTSNMGPITSTPLTNADRIRSMTDEELAEFMNDVAQRGGIPVGGSVMKWFTWLKQEVNG